MSTTIPAQALDTYLAREAAFITAVAAGVADADAGRTISHKQIDTWLASWGNDDEEEPPTQC